jgi:hypothetical protein
MGKPGICAALYRLNKGQEKRFLAGQRPLDKQIFLCYLFSQEIEGKRYP